MADFRTSPRYQRALQRLSRMSPSERAIIDSRIADETFATEEMRGRLQSMRMAADKQFAAERLKLGEGRLGLAKRSFRFEKRQLPIAYGIGAAGVAASGYYGYRKQQFDTSLAERLNRRYR